MFAVINPQWLKFGNSNSFLILIVIRNYPYDWGLLDKLFIENQRGSPETAKDSHTNDIFVRFREL